ncbi:MAG: hypothetical protein AVDCRST_MAG12-331 [uncultured Rubrobacteraceae bacterium]|uniref:Uncharacterized protein n=1 Tax=uncultured Rubrobacteraceae bacterium TaxID=349277 RepID=A0A6J4RAW5_9ACTN|nr:MAG: hypothetical protein AVDCRST_MAG12-331 [uncultured Rubrobacteraceae bacterium]
MEVLKNGTIRGGRALSRTSTGSPPEDWGRTDTEDPQQHWLDFGEIASSVGAMVHFCAAAFATSRPGIELEVLFGMANCQGHLTRIPGGGRSRSHTGQIPPSSFYQQPVLQNAVVRTLPSGGKVNEEDLLALIREISRLFSISAPDDLLHRYVN